MKQWITGIIAAAFIIVTGATSASAASTNNFTITNFTVDYHLSRDDSGRSTLKTVERITANFPQANQNHGLERALPLRYANHPTSLKIVSIVDEQGNALKYSGSDSYDNRVIRIGDADTYVHGLQTYVITYTQRDVTRFFADTERDEFYWDTNGTQWAVAIERLLVKITIEDSIVAAIGSTACYQGVQGVSNACQLKHEGSVLTTSAEVLAPGENVTVAVGFAQNTFAAYEMTAIERVLAIAKSVWVVGLIVLSPISIALLVWALVRWSRVQNRSREVGIIVPEYLPPHDYSVTASSHIEGVSSKVFTAQLIDFAVRHYIRIYQTKAATTFKSAQYELELMKPVTDLKAEEKALIDILFPTPTIGSRFAMKKLQTSSTLGASVRSVFNQFDSSSESIGLRQKDKVQSRWFKRLGGWMMVVGGVLLSPVMFILGVIVFCMAFGLRPLTDAGLTLRRYLFGLKRYIAVAEADRLRMLQSPEGAEKVGAVISGDDQAQVVKLYERVLPYAILFNLEKDWNKQLGAYYESAGQQPDWYQGTGVFNAAAFGAAMGSFSATAASSYASPSSSSTGGSGGGGFSGGGGGGGGGGGW